MKKIILDKDEYDLLVKRADATLKEIEDTIDIGVKNRMDKWADKVRVLESKLTHKDKDIEELHVIINKKSEAIKLRRMANESLSTRNLKLENSNFYLRCTIFVLIILLTIMLINYGNYI